MTSSCFEGCFLWQVSAKGGILIRSFSKGQDDDHGISWRHGTIARTRRRARRGCFGQDLAAAGSRVPAHLYPLPRGGPGLGLTATGALQCQCVAAHGGTSRGGPAERRGRHPARDHPEAAPARAPAAGTGRP